MVVTLPVCHFDRSPLNARAPSANTDNIDYIMYVNIINKKKFKNKKEQENWLES